MFIDMILMQAWQNFKMLIFFLFFIRPTCTLKSTNVKQKLVNLLIHKMFKARNHSMLYSYICKTFPEIKIFFFLPLEYSKYFKYAIIYLWLQWWHSKCIQLKRGPLLGALKLLVKHVPAGNLTVQRVGGGYF